MVFKQNTRREFIKQNPRNDKTRFSDAFILKD